MQAGTLPPVACIVWVRVSKSGRLGAGGVVVRWCGGGGAAVKGVGSGGADLGGGFGGNLCVDGS